MHKRIILIMDAKRVLFALFVCIATVSATTEVNWTEIGGYISGIADIMPDVLSLIVAILPIMIVLGLITFALGLLAGILASIRKRV